MFNFSSQLVSSLEMSSIRVRRIKNLVGDMKVLRSTEYFHITSTYWNECEHSHHRKRLCMYTVKCMWMENMSVHAWLTFAYFIVLWLFENIMNWTWSLKYSYSYTENLMIPTEKISDYMWSNQMYRMQLRWQIQHSRKQMLMKLAAQPKVFLIEVSIWVSFVFTVFGRLH